MLNFYSKYLFGVWQRLNGKHSILESTFLVQDSLLQIPQNDAVTEVAWFGKVLNYHNFYESKVQRALFCIIIRSDWVYLRHNTLTENYKNQNKPKTTKKEIWVYLTTSSSTKYPWTLNEVKKGFAYLYSWDNRNFLWWTQFLVLHPLHIILMKNLFQKSHH